MKELTKEQLEVVLNQWDNTHPYNTFRDALKEKGLIKEEFEVGDYMIVEGTNIGDEYNGSLAIIGEKSVNDEYLYWAVGVAGRKYNPSGLYSRGRKATDKEVETALIKEAKKRGFKEGDFVESVYNKNYSGNIDGSFWVNECYEVWSKSLSNRYSIQLFEKGKWATIIKEEPIQELTMADVEKLAGGKVKIIK